MSSKSLWLGGHQSEVERDTLYSDLNNADDKRVVGSIRWDDNLKLEETDYLLHFQALSPKCSGSLSSVEMEKKCIIYAYDWFMYMTIREHDREVFEAAILVVAAITILEEKAAKCGIEAIDTCDIFGYTLPKLLHYLGKVLIPNVVKRLRNLVEAAVRLQISRQTSSKREQRATIMGLASSYDGYLRWRCLDGYYEIALLCSFAAMGESCEKLTVGIANDILEAAILAHDSHSVLRHFTEDEIANCHRYLDSSLDKSIKRAFHRIAILRNNIRLNSDIPASIKECAMIAITSCHAFNYSCKRYKYGADFAQAAAFAASSSLFKNPFKGDSTSAQPYSKLKNHLRSHRI